MTEGLFHLEMLKSPHIQELYAVVRSKTFTSKDLWQALESTDTQDQAKVVLIRSLAVKTPPSEHAVIWTLLQRLFVPSLSPLVLQALVDCMFLDLKDAVMESLVSSVRLLVYRCDSAWPLVLSALSRHVERFDQFTELLHLAFVLDLGKEQQGRWRFVSTLDTLMSGTTARDQVQAQWQTFVGLPPLVMPPSLEDLRVQSVMVRMHFACETKDSVLALKMVVHLLSVACLRMEFFGILDVKYMQPCLASVGRLLSSEKPDLSRCFASAIVALVAFLLMHVQWTETSADEQLLLDTCREVLALFGTNSLEYAAVLRQPLLHLLGLNSERSGHSLISDLLAQLSRLSFSTCHENTIHTVFDGCAPNHFGRYLITSLQECQDEGHAVGFLMLSSLLFNVDGTIDEGILFQLTQHPYADKNPADLLPLLLLILRQNNSGALIISIFHEIIPQWIERHPKDGFLLGRVLKIYSHLIEHGDAQVASLVLRGLYMLWTRQPRAWPYLYQYLNSWVRKFRHELFLKLPKEVSDTKQHDMELAVMVTIRDVCVDYAYDHGYDLLPLVYTAIKKVDSFCNDVLRWMLEAVNGCIEADVIDIISGYKTFVRPMLNTATAFREKNVEVYEQVCRFYGLVAKKTENTDSFVTFKDDVLMNQLLPLTGLGENCETGIDPQIRQWALDQLAHFSSPDLVLILPPPVEILVHDFSGADVRPLLVSLIEYEIANMRRSVFKGTGVAVGGDGRKAARAEVAETEDPLAYVKRSWQDLSSTLACYWDQDTPEKLTTVSPSLRSSLTSASMCFFAEIVSTLKRRHPEKVEYDLIESLSQRMFDSALTDVSPPDSELLKMTTLSAWLNLFKQMLPLVLPIRIRMWMQADAEFAERQSEQVQAERIKLARENILRVMVDDLLVRRYQDTKVPSVRANLILASTSLVLAVDQLGMPGSAELATQTLRVLMDRHVERWVESQESAEIDKSVFQALGCLIPVVAATEDPLAFETFSKLLALSNLNVASEKAEGMFEIGRALVHTVPSLPESLFQGHEQRADLAAGLTAMFGHLLTLLDMDFDGRIDDAPALNPFCVSGISAGLASSSDFASTFSATTGSSQFDELVKKSLPFLERLSQRLESRKPLAISPHIQAAISLCLSISPMIEATKLPVVWKLLELLEQRFRGKPEYAYSLNEVIMALSIIAPIFAIVNSSDHDIIQSLAVKRFKSITDESLTAVQRLSHLDALVCLLGFRSTRALVGTLQPDVLNDIQRMENIFIPSVKLLCQLSDLTIRRGDIKVVRSSLLIFAEILCAWHDIETAVVDEDELGSQEATDFLGKKEASQTRALYEKAPTDYRRLAPDQSYLRAVFDRLCSRIQESSWNEMTLLLDLLANVEHSLPAVDWSLALKKLLGVQLSHSTEIAITNFAFKHGATSKSLTQFSLGWLNSSIRGIEFVFNQDDAERLIIVIRMGVPYLTRAFIGGLIGKPKWLEAMMEYVICLFHSRNVSEKSLYFQVLFLQAVKDSVGDIHSHGDTIKQAHHELAWSILNRLLLTSTVLDKRVVELVECLSVLVTMKSLKEYECALLNLNLDVAVIFGASVVSALKSDLRKARVFLLGQMFQGFAQLSVHAAVLAIDVLFSGTAENDRCFVLEDLLDVLILHGSDKTALSWLTTAVYRWSFRWRSLLKDDLNHVPSPALFAYTLTKLLQQLSDSNRKSVIKRLMNLAQTFDSVRYALVCCVLSVTKCADSTVADPLTWSNMIKQDVHLYLFR